MSGDETQHEPLDLAKLRADAKALRDRIGHGIPDTLLACADEIERLRAKSTITQPLMQSANCACGAYPCMCTTKGRGML